MKKFGLIYGTETGTTEVVGEKICTAIWSYGYPVKMFEVEQIKACTLKSLDIIILGTPTYGHGEAFDDWAAFEYRLCGADLTGKTVALFGLGDQLNYPNSFLDALGWLYQSVNASGARVVGSWPTIGYRFSQTTAATQDGRMFYGLGLDEHNQPECTDFRVTNWVSYLMYEIEQTAANQKMREHTAGKKLCLALI